jgi:hypothetical protein
MRHINALAPERVPRDEQFHFRERAEALVEKWHQILKPNGDHGANGAAKSDGGHEAVTVSTAALNLNGNVTEGPRNPVVGDQGVEEPQAGDDLAPVGDISALGDMTMSEA